MDEWCTTLPLDPGRYVVCLEDLVLFVYSVHHGCKFLLAARLVCPTTDRYTVRPEFRPPHQPGLSVVGGSMTSLR